MASLLDQLNPAQREVAEIQRHCLAVAVPGSGKTKTIATRAALLLADPANLVGAVTFSKDAAVELRERILALANEGAKERLLATTFHSLAFKLLGVKGSKRPAVASEGDRLAMVRIAINETGSDLKPEDAIKSIDAFKSRVGEVVEETPEARVYHAYQHALERNGMLDFQDMMLQAVSGLQRGTIRPFPFTHLLVDEYQDCDPIQLSLLTLIARATGSLVTAVGDDDQSIYGFRSALGFRGMESFIREFDATPVVLGSNYRSRAEVLEAADRLIQKNRDRIPKTLVASRGPGGSVSFHRFADEYTEGTAAVEALGPVLRNRGSAAVLTRSNRQLDAVGAICRTHGLKYYRASGKSILDRPEGALMGTLLELVQQSRTGGLDAALAFAGAGGEELRALHAAHGSSMDRPQKKSLLDLGLSERTADVYRTLLKRLGEWRALYGRQFFVLVLDGVHEWMQEHAKTDSAKRAITTTYGVLSRLNGPFSERLEFLRRKNNEPAPDALILTTAHSSKGLEWDSVWIAGAGETAFPNEKSTEVEERRLFYVAMTRARDHLTMSVSRKYPTSRFVIEAGFG